MKGSSSSLYFAAAFCLCISGGMDAEAVPAYPGPIATQQPDGTEIVVRKTGDEWFHSVEDEDERTILQDPDTGYWVYAEQDEKGELRRSSHKVGQTDVKQMGIPKHLRSASAMEAAKRARHLREGGPGRTRTIQGAKAIKKGTIKNLVLLVAFSDKPFTYSKSDFEKLFNQEGYSVGGAHGSVKDYYNEVSYGQVNMESIIAGPVTLSHDYAYYGKNNASGSDTRPREMVSEALELLNQTGFDFSQVDGDGDGWVDGFDVIHSGYDEAAYSDANCIWSHNWSLSSTKTYGGVSFSTYHTEAELYIRNNKVGITAIGVPCHETGHFLGLPDLYDIDYSSSGIGRFCLMSGGSWCDDGLRPVHMNAWCKMKLGWISPSVISAPGEYSLSRIEDHAEAYKIQGNLPSNEYFLLENRQGCLFDSAMPGSKRGILIWHIDSSLDGNDNQINNNPKHFGVDLEEASGTQHLEDTKTSSVQGDDLDYFRSDNMSSFTSSTTPNSKGWKGTELGLDIKNISASSDTMTFTVPSAGAPLGIDPSERGFSASAASSSFSVAANSSWTVTKSDSWIKLKTTGGNGNGTVAYSVDANTDSRERSGTITVKCGTETATHGVKQSADAARLIIDPDAADFSNVADTGSFSVSANCAWTVTPSHPWITVDMAGGNGNGTVSYSVGENTGSRRTGTITVASGTLTASHAITQEAQPTLIIGSPETTMDADGGDGSFSVTSDSMWTVTKSGSATWLTLHTTSGNGNGRVSYSVGKNTGARRTGCVYVKSGTVQGTFTVNQRCANAVTFSESTVSIPAEGGKGTVTATVLMSGSGTLDASGSSSGGWVSWTRSEATITDGYRYTYSWTAEANTTGAERKETIDVTLNGTPHACTLVQDAEAGSYRVTYRPGSYGTGDEITIAKPGGGLLILRGETYKRTGYTQTGWATTDGGPTVYGLKEWYADGKSIVLYPHWEKIPTTYTVTFRPGDFGSGGSQTIQKTEGVALALPGALFTRSGYEQKGWSTSAAGDSKAYELGGQYTKDAPATFYPYWEKAPGGVPDIAFACYDATWEVPAFLNTTNTEWGLYLPKTIFESGDSLRLNYCLHNYGTATAAADSITRYVSLYHSEGTILKYVTENFEKGHSIKPGGNLQFRSSNVDGWLSSVGPGNYAIQVHLDPTGKSNIYNDNWWRTWFVARMPGVTLKEALDCKALDFVLEGEDAPVTPLHDGIATDGLSVQFGPQGMDVATCLRADVTGPGTLSFKWDAQCEEDTNACMVCYVDDDMEAYTWGKPLAWEGEAWENASVEVGEGVHRVWWEFWTYEPDPRWLTVGWLDNVTWTPAREKYAVVYKPGSSGSGLQRTDTKEQGIPVELRGSIFTRTGYAQTGWAKSDGGAKAYELGATYTADADITLYPFWTIGTSSVEYDLNGGTAGALHPETAIFNKAFRVSAPSRNGYEFMGWMVTSGLDAATARYGASADDLPNAIVSANQQCFNGPDEDVWFINLASVAGGKVTLTATWELADDGRRDIGFYAPSEYGWDCSLCLSSSNLDYLAYAPETEFPQDTNVFLSFCAVNWSRSGSALLQSTLLTFTDETGKIVEQGEPIQRHAIGAVGYHEFRNIPLASYLEGVPPGRYKLTAELDPNEFLNDPNRSNNATSLWFTVTRRATAKYTLAFNPGTGGTGKMENMDVEVGSTVTLPGCGFTRDKYRFAGWGKSAESGVAYAAGWAGKLTNASGKEPADGETVTLYAQWTPAQDVPQGPAISGMKFNASGRPSGILFAGAAGTEYEIQWTPSLLEGWGFWTNWTADSVAETEIPVTVPDNTQRGFFRIVTVTGPASAGEE